MIDDSQSCYTRPQLYSDCHSSDEKRAPPYTWMVDGQTFNTDFFCYLKLFRSGFCVFHCQSQLCLDPGPSPCHHSHDDGSDPRLERTIAMVDWNVVASIACRLLEVSDSKREIVLRQAVDILSSNWLPSALKNSACCSITKVILACNKRTASTKEKASWQQKMK